LALASTPEAVVASREANTPIEHFIVLMQENHSFDNYFGTYPGADGIPEGTCIPVDPTDEQATCIEPFHLGDNEVEMADPDHSESTHRLQYNQGKMDGFVWALEQRNQDGRLAMGYYDERDLPFHWNVADEYVLFDRFFSSAAGGSLINHLYWVAAGPGEEKGRDQQEVLAETPTIFDRLQDAGISWKFYIQNYDPDITYRTVHLFPGNRSSQVIWAPLLNFDRFLDDPELSNNIVDMEEYFRDLIDGTLPQVAFMVPSGPSEHPPSNVGSGQRFVKNLLQALMQSDYWLSSAFLWAYDDWGGWYDHVPPPQVDEYGYGFRVPALLVSAYARRGFIDSTTLDYTSILKFIEDNWYLPPLAERDANANSIVSAFDFTQVARPAAFLPLERVTDSVTAKAEPRRNVIYLAYGGVLLLATALILLAALRLREPTLDLDWLLLDTPAGAARRPQETAISGRDLQVAEQRLGREVTAVQGMLKGLAGEQSTTPEQLKTSLTEAEELLSWLRAELAATLDPQRLQAINSKELTGQGDEDQNALLLHDSPETPVGKPPVPGVVAEKLPMLPRLPDETPVDLDSWLEQILGEPGVLGGVLLDGQGETVVGKLPPGVRLPDRALFTLEHSLRGIGNRLQQGDPRILILGMAERMLMMAWPTPEHQLLILLGDPSIQSLIVHRLHRDLDALGRLLGGTEA